MGKPEIVQGQTEPSHGRVSVPECKRVQSRYKLSAKETENMLLNLALHEGIGHGIAGGQIHGNDPTELMWTQALPNNLKDSVLWFPPHGDFHPPYIMEPDDPWGNLKTTRTPQGAEWPRGY